MNCREFQENVIDVAFGEAGRSTDFDRHLESCDECKREFFAAQFAAKGIEDAPSAPAPSLSNERLHQAILSRDLRTRPFWLPRLALTGAAAALALAAWMGFSRGPEVIQPRDVAMNTAPNAGTLEAPEGPIEIPEEVPEIVVSSEPVVKASPGPTVRREPAGNRRLRKPRTETIVASVPETVELLAVVMSGAESAFDSDPMASRAGPTMETAPGAAATFAESAPSVPENQIIVIQGKGQATERPSDDVAIGG